MKTIAKIYYPIISRLLNAVIPLEEDLIYSTLMRCTYYINEKKKKNFTTPVLMTKSGFAWYDERISLTSGKRQNVFYNWSQIQIVDNYIMVGRKDYLQLERYRKDRKEVYETIGTFERRKENFRDLISSYVENYNQEKNAGNLDDTYVCAYDLKDKLKIWPRCTNCKKSNKKLHYFCQFCGKNLIVS